MTLVLGNKHKVGENDGILPMSLRDHEIYYMEMRKCVDRGESECGNQDWKFSGSLLFLTLWFNQVGRYQVFFFYFLTLLVPCRRHWVCELAGYFGVTGRGICFTAPFRTLFSGSGREYSHKNIFFVFYWYLVSQESIVSGYIFKHVGL